VLILRTYPEFYTREYDKLNWFGFDMFGYPLMDMRSGGIRFAATQEYADGRRYAPHGQR
jgi:hypothetical protein